MKIRMAGQEVQEKYRQEKSGGEEPARSRHRQKKRGHKGVGSLTLTVLFLVTLLVAVRFYLQGKRREAETGELVYEANIMGGDISGKMSEERQRELDSIVKGRVLVMSVNAMPCGKTTGADRSINWLVGNPSNQGKLTRVEVWRDDMAEKIYETGAIPPGNHVEAAPLSMELPPGEYRYTARSYAYKGDETCIG